MFLRSRLSLAPLALVLAACASQETPPPATVATPAPSAAPSPAPVATVAPPPAEVKKAEVKKVDPFAEKVAAFAPAKLTADTSRLAPNEKQALDKLIAAARLMDPIFDRQAYAKNPELRAKLAADTSPEGRSVLAFYDLNRGPWDERAEFAPFGGAGARPKGAGFYPEDLTADDFHAYAKAHPKEKEALEDLATVIRRDGNKLVAVPYGTAYAEWLKPAAALMNEAAALTKNKTLAKFLKSRAAAFLSNSYYQSDKDWMDLDSDVEVTIGPYETYEDSLLDLKASFEAFVTISDPVASQKLAKYKALLPAMEKNLPIPDSMRTTRGKESPIRVVDLVFSSGDARKSVQTIAFNLPNDEKVRKEKGAKKVLLRNLIETKFDVIMRPLAEQIIDASQTQYLSSEAFFNETLFHELSHSLGPAFTKVDGKNVEVHVALGPVASRLEEAKADVMGAYNILYMVKKGEMPQEFANKLLVSYFAGLFRSARFGVAEAHGQGAAMQINRYLEDGGATFDGKRFKVNFDKLEAAITRLVHDICVLQHDGDKKGAEALMAKYGVMSEPMAKAFASIGNIPVDIRPIYPLAGE